MVQHAIDLSKVVAGLLRDGAARLDARTATKMPLAGEIDPVLKPL